MTDKAGAVTATVESVIPLNRDDPAHVRCTFLYMSLPFSSKQQREMTKY